MFCSYPTAPHLAAFILRSESVRGPHLTHRSLSVPDCRMSRENPLWGAPRIHGELLKLGFELAKSTVANGMDRPYSRP